MTDRLEGLSPLGIDPAARAASLTRVRRDEQSDADGRGRQEEPESDEQFDADDAEDDGRPHIDVRA
jgi:hypothetical protein